MITDGELERMRDALRVDVSDPKVAQAWAEQAKKDLDALLEELDTMRTEQGGSFVVGLRAALEDRVVRRLNGRAALTDETKLASLGVHVVPGVGVAVDVRLTLGVWKQ